MQIKVKYCKILQKPMKIIVTYVGYIKRRFNYSIRPHTFIKFLIIFLFFLIGSLNFFPSFRPSYLIVFMKINYKHLIRGTSNVLILLSCKYN